MTDVVTPAVEEALDLGDGLGVEDHAASEDDQLGPLAGDQRQAEAGTWMR